MSPRFVPVCGPLGCSDCWWVQDESGLERAVAVCDVVVSLVPAPFHPPVAKAAIKHKKNMVTASYVSPAMAALDAECVSAGIVVLNEAGLDPGIDHMSAIKMINDLKARGSRQQPVRVCISLRFAWVWFL
jgi:alpha-aminoadipic semialdehyde synthase